METKVIVIGFINHGSGQHQSNTVFSFNGNAPTVTTLQGGTQQIKVLRKWKRKSKR